MNYHKGFAAVTALLVVLGLIIVAGGGYVALNPQVLEAPADVQTEAGDHPEEEQEAGEGMTGDAKISWTFTSIGELQGTPYTSVAVTVGDKTYEAGKFAGSCTEVGATGGVDGKGLLAGELSAAQCWYAGGGDEIGVFAHEDGGYEIMVGELQEPVEGGDSFRGNFEIKVDIHP